MKRNTSRDLALVALFETGRSAVRTFTNFLSRQTSHREQVEASVAAGHFGPLTTERSSDRNEDVEKGVNLSRRERWGTFAVGCCGIISIGSGVGFVYVYWSSANTFLLGGTLALCFGGLGLALVFWAHSLMVQKEAIAPREPMQSSRHERELLLAAFNDGKQDVKRRTLLTWIGAGFAAVLAAAWVSSFRSFGTPPGPSLKDRIWKRGQRLMTPNRTPVSVHALQTGSTMVVFPEDSIGDEKAQTVLIRVNEKFLDLPKEHADWAPMGYLAYSRVCTHAGCPVGLYQTQTHLLLCPCHQSSFDVLKGAQPTGGPAPRALPQVPLYVGDDGILRAGGPFTQPPGPGFWGMPV